MKGQDLGSDTPKILLVNAYHWNQCWKVDLMWYFWLFAFYFHKNVALQILQTRLALNYPNRHFSIHFSRLSVLMRQIFESIFITLSKYDSIKSKCFTSRHSHRFTSADRFVRSPKIEDERKTIFEAIFLTQP